MLPWIHERGARTRRVRASKEPRQAKMLAFLFARRRSESRLHHEPLPLATHHRKYPTERLGIFYLRYRNKMKTRKLFAITPHNPICNYRECYNSLSMKLTIVKTGLRRLKRSPGSSKTNHSTPYSCPNSLEPSKPLAILTSSTTYR